MAYCTRILRSDLKALAADCRTTGDLYGQWLGFGEDPFIVTTDRSPAVECSSREYVRTPWRRGDRFGPWRFLPA
ncbi:hypothetical protein [Geminicoccus flavidas]|uniref:hypothetical protein n=1 Tax=Geminicoccus flavidas TaxID=2506407 RepID=UPI00135CC6A4|nr:hypothetical protein [Geminicoccus flavidas]